MSGDDERRQRAVMATDAEWERICRSAAASGMDRSRFVIHRALMPDALSSEVLRRAVRETRQAASRPRLLLIVVFPSWSAGHPATRHFDRSAVGAERSGEVCQRRFHGIEAAKISSLRRAAHGSGRYDDGGRKAGAVPIKTDTL